MKKSKILIKEINEGKNLKENVPIYYERMLDLSHKIATLDFALEYYTLCETMVEGLNPRLTDIKDTLANVEDAVRRLFLDEEKDKNRIWDSLRTMREDVMERQETLTSIIDELVIYEHVFNRMEPRFESPEFFEERKREWFQEEAEMVQRLMRYIFRSKENVVINDGIKDVIEQLPVRMTKSKFFELLNQSLTIYKGSDKASLERYLYGIRTSAMLYESKEDSGRMVEFKDLLDELESVDYKEMTKETFVKLQGKIEEACGKLHELTESYIQQSTLINDLMAYTLTRGYDCDTNPICLNLIQNVFRIMEKRRKEDEKDASFDMPHDLLYELEGEMEKDLEEMAGLESLLYHIGEHYAENLKESFLETRHNDLITIQKLLSDSVYVDLEENGDREVADAAYVNQCAMDLIEEMDGRFRRMQKPVMRAVMAVTLSKMPVFFNSIKEVEDYISHAFRTCTDVAENIASASLLETIMEEGNW